MKKHILAHDLGTSGNKATLYDIEGSLVASTLYEYKTCYPQVNWAEQEPEDWWTAVCVSTRELLDKSGITGADIACIAFSAQMMGCLPVDRGGNALRKSIIWADSRSVEQAEFMKSMLGMENAYKVTGHRISASYSGAKILWVKDNEPEIYRRTYKILQAKDYIIYRLTGAFITDYSDASGTNMFDIRNKAWSEDIVKSLGLKTDILPEPHPSTDIIGRITSEAAGATGLLQGTPVVAGGGDGSCAAVGAGVIKKGEAYNAIGSSSWIALASEEPVFDPDMKTFNWVHLDPALYSPCGTMQSAGYSYNWLKNTLCGLESLEAGQLKTSAYKIIDDKIMSSPPGANKLIFLPYLLGERSPRWNPDAKGAFVGLNIKHTKEDIFRSVLEGVGYNLKVLLDIFDKSAGIEKVTAIGGGAKGQVWLQILADIWQKPVQIPQFIEEATSLGAAVCGGVGIGAFKDFSVVKKHNPIKREIMPRHEYAQIYSRLYEVFNEAYTALEPVYGGLAGI